MASANPYGVTSIRLEPPDREWLDAECNQRKVSRTEVLRDALALYRIIPPATRRGFLKSAEEEEAFATPRV